MGVVRTVWWLLADREPRVARTVSAGVLGTVAGILLVHGAVTAPWVADTGRAVRTQTFVNATPGVVR